MVRPVIALLTDFGTRDHYVGAMKGVILGICPDVMLVDISHEVPPHDIFAGALELGAAYRYFPASSIFLAVVDPGVGSDRRGVAAEIGEYRFVAPDNGLLTAVLQDEPPRRLVELGEPRYARPTVSRTFEGRDRFAPAAAWLAQGVDLDALGPPTCDLHRLAIPQPDASGSAIIGQVLRIDRFGNLITNIDRRSFERLAEGGTVEVRAGGHRLPGVVSTYADVGRGEVCALFGSTDHLELAANGASAALELGLDRGAPVHVKRRA
jgi:S-adenosylmethionine hydrolase